MEFALPKLGKAPVELEHFPNPTVAFLFRAFEYVTPEKIAAILDTTPETVIAAAARMGLDRPCTDSIWLEKGYITIIRRLWHLLPYEQLLQLLETDDQTLAVLMREEDFLDIKLGDKPACQPVRWVEPDEEALRRMDEIGSIVRTLPDHVTEEPFQFSYHLKPMELSGEAYFRRRILYPFSCLYLHALDVDSHTFLTDEMLEAYQKTGVNGIWLQGCLFQLTPFPFLPELSVGWEDRLARLKALTERCAKFGLKIYLYINEPRSMQDNFYEVYPHLRGHEAKEGKICLCTSTKEVQDYLIGGISAICRAVPQLGGFITITRSENPTNCYSHSTRETCTCPRCSQRSEAEVIAEVINCFQKGAAAVSPDIKVFAWSWRWDDFNLDIIERLDPNIILQSQSELHVPTNVGGIPWQVCDYSMSVLGPGERAKTEWAAARKRGMEVSAKVQVNTTWECSTVPALPVYPLIEKHISDIRKEGVSNIMLSWTLGGYPSSNIQHLGKYFFEHCALADDTPGQKHAAALFSEAFQEFPIHVVTMYNGPQNPGPSTMLFRKPTGYRSTMTCYPYDDLDTWRRIYPRDIFENQFSKLCTKWAEGLRILEQEPDDEMKTMAQAAYCIFRASLNQIRFYIARDANDFAAMRRAAEDELIRATDMLELMNHNAALGFEAANHYYYSRGCLKEKVVNCRYLLQVLPQ